MYSIEFFFYLFLVDYGQPMLEVYKYQAEKILRAIICELKGIQTLKHLMDSEEHIYEKSREPVVVMILIKELEEKRVFIPENKDHEFGRTLMKEMQRIYTIQRRRKLMEQFQRIVFLSSILLIGGQKNDCRRSSFFDLGVGSRLALQS